MNLIYPCRIFFENLNYRPFDKFCLVAWLVPLLKTFWNYRSTVIQLVKFPWNDWKVVKKFSISFFEILLTLLLTFTESDAKWHPKGPLLGMPVLEVWFSFSKVLKNHNFFFWFFGEIERFIFGTLEKENHALKCCRIAEIVYFCLR